MNSSLLSTLVGRVRQERLRLGWTQAAAAARVGIPARSYQRFEQLAKITLPRLERVLAAFGLTLTVVSAEGATPPAPDPRVLHTRQRGLRRSGSAAPSQPESSTAGAVATSTSGTERCKPAPPKPTARVDPALITAVVKSQRDRIIMAVRAIVSNGLNNYTSYQVVQNLMDSARGLAEGDRPAFVAATVSQLNGLNAENIAGYGIGRTEFDRWAQSWNPDLGVVDVLADTASP